MHLIFSAIHDTIIFVCHGKPHPRMVLMALYLPAFLMCLLFLLLLFSSSAPMDIQVSAVNGNPCQVPLTLLCYGCGCSPLCVSCFHKSLVSCLQESKGKPGSYRLGMVPHCLAYLFHDPAVAEVCTPVQRNHLL